MHIRTNQRTYIDVASAGQRNCPRKRASEEEFIKAELFFIYGQNFRVQHRNAFWLLIVCVQAIFFQNILLWKLQSRPRAFLTYISRFYFYKTFLGTRRSFFLIISTTNRTGNCTNQRTQTNRLFRLFLRRPTQWTNSNQWKQILEDRIHESGIVFISGPNFRVQHTHAFQYVVDRLYAIFSLEILLSTFGFWKNNIVLHLLQSFQGTLCLRAKCANVDFSKLWCRLPR